MRGIKIFRSNWRRNLTVVAAGLLLAAGGYILLVALSPQLGTGGTTHETEKKLAQPPGTHGDRLYIPQINVNVAIVTGNDSSVLEKGAWHRRPENGNPARGGNFVLSAHRFVMSITPQGTVLKSPFYHIDKLAVGDRLFVDYQNKRYQYIVSKKYDVKPHAIEIEAPTKEPRLTLYSCTLQGSSDGRNVIEAVPAESPAG